MYTASCLALFAVLSVRALGTALASVQTTDPHSAFSIYARDNDINPRFLYARSLAPRRLRARQAPSPGHDRRLRRRTGEYKVGLPFGSNQEGAYERDASARERQEPMSALHKSLQGPSDLFSKPKPLQRIQETKEMEGEPIQPKRSPIATLHKEAPKEAPKVERSRLGRQSSRTSQKEPVHNTALNPHMLEHFNNQGEGPTSEDPRKKVEQHLKAKDSSRSVITDRNMLAAGEKGSLAGHDHDLKYQPPESIIDSEVNPRNAKYYHRQSRRQQEKHEKETKQRQQRETKERQKETKERQKEAKRKAKMEGSASGTMTSSDVQRAAAGGGQQGTSQETQGPSSSGPRERKSCLNCFGRFSGRRGHADEPAIYSGQAGAGSRRQSKEHSSTQQGVGASQQHAAEQGAPHHGVTAGRQSTWERMRGKAGEDDEDTAQVTIGRMGKDHAIPVRDMKEKAKDSNI